MDRDHYLHRGRVASYFWAVFVRSMALSNMQAWIAFALLRRRWLCRQLLRCVDDNDLHFR
jgi:hypothetical protein